MLRNSRIVTFAPIDLGGGGGGGDDNSATPSSSSTQKSDEAIIQELIKGLRSWAVANDGDAKHDRFSYWALKVPAFALAAGTSALETFGFHSAVIVMGVVSAMCIAIDAAYPHGLLYNIHRQAANEIFLLEARVNLEWNKVVIQFRGVSTAEGIENHKARTLEILTMVESETQRINDYLTAGEASLDKKLKTSP